MLDDYLSSNLVKSHRNKTNRWAQWKKTEMKYLKHGSTAFYVPMRTVDRNWKTEYFEDDCINRRKPELNAPKNKTFLYYDGYWTKDGLERLSRSFWRKLLGFFLCLDFFFFYNKWSSIYSRHRLTESIIWCAASKPKRISSLNHGLIKFFSISCRSKLLSFYHHIPGQCRDPLCPS